jgi:hypothetical protein
VTAARVLQRSTGPRWVRVTWRSTVPEQHSLIAVDPDRSPDDAPVALRQPDGERPAGWLVDVRCCGRDDAVLRIDVAPGVAVPGPPIWFAEVHHGSSGVPAATLLAFTGGGVPAGRLLRPHEVARRGLAMTDHLAAVRWQLRSGLVESVIVRAGWRGRGLGRLVVTAAEGLRALRDWAPLVSDGRLTDAGAAWLAGSPPYWQPRLAPRCACLPPEPEPGRPTGVARLLR